MSYVTYPHFGSDDAKLGLSKPSPAGRTQFVAATIGEASTVIGGGLLFAATMYLMIVLPSLL